MRRFFCPSKNIFDNEVRIKDSQSVHHIKDVLRMKDQDKILIFDGQGNDYECKVVSIDKRCILLIIISHIKRQEKDLNITLACSLTRRGKFDYIVEKATELGANRIIPIYAKRSIVKSKKDNNSLERHWKRIIQNASEQSGRIKLPIIERACDFNRALEITKKSKVSFIANCIERDMPYLYQVLRNKQTINNITIFIGPEGDFTPLELARAKKNGCIPVKLTDTVLKVDTACLYALSIIVGSVNKN